MLDKVGIVELPKIPDARGNLTFIEADRHVPFEFKRIYYLYDVPAGESRGGHAHRQLQQLVIAAAGSFDVVLDDGTDRRTFTLDNPSQGLFMSCLIWRELESFSPGAVCLVLASDYYDEGDYIRDYGTFLAASRQPVTGEDVR